MLVVYGFCAVTRYSVDSNVMRYIPLLYQENANEIISLL